MPSVVGRQLDVALQDIKLAGFNGEVDVAGGGMLGIIDESNWQVCKQSPAAGKALTATPQVSVDRTCGANTPSSTATASPPPSDDVAPQADPSDVAEPTVSETAESKPLTRATSADFQRLLKLTDQCSSEIATFASRYEGRSIAFDGSIVAMNNYNEESTRYNILVNAGNFSATKAIPGPNFQFRNVNVTDDLKLTGPNIPDTIGVGQNLRVVARVNTYVSNQCLFLLDPVSTQVR